MSFTLYLIRHSKAQTYHASGDFYRELSFEGVQRLEELFSRLKYQEFQTELYLTSPYIRTKQTAYAFFSFFSPQKEPAKTVNILSSLVPDGDPQEVLDELQNHALNGVSSCALFTHNPLAPLLAQWFVARKDFYFYAPTIMAIHFSTMPQQGEGQLMWIEQRVK